VLLGGGILGGIALIAIFLLRICPIVLAWRGTNVWSSVTEAIKTQPETTSFGWLAPQNRSIRYVVGPEQDDVIDATGQRWGSTGASLEARSARASIVLRRAVQQANADGASGSVSIRYFSQPD